MVFVELLKSLVAGTVIANSFSFPVNEVGVVDESVSGGSEAAGDRTVSDVSLSAAEENGISIDDVVVLEVNTELGLGLVVEL